MRQGYLSDYFVGIAIKHLSTVEAHMERSNQHEFHGSEEMRRFLGSERKVFPARFLYLEDTETTVTAEGTVTWYDSRKNQPTRSAEYRLYFTTTEVSDQMSAGDLLLVGLRPDGTVLVVIARSGSTSESQLRWLFGFTEQHYTKFSSLADFDSDRHRVTSPIRLILEELQIETPPHSMAYLDEMRFRFGDTFPSTADFSAYARETASEVEPLDDPDETLMVWVEQEEHLFRIFENYLVSERLASGFYTSEGHADVDGFIDYSLSVHNRRKSRAGRSLEHHLRCIFDAHRLAYTHAPQTENKSTPDFLFPGISCYRQPDFDADRLTMLGVKRTCKDRWRQVLSEAVRIKRKHLLTLEPAISEPQTREMSSKNLVLVLPDALHSTFTARQQSQLLNVKSFINLIKDRQSA